MKTKLILRLALVLSAPILFPNLVRAEDRIWMDGKINGQPVRLAFDTGASGPILFKRSVERLGLKFTAPTNATPTSPNKVMLGSTEYCEFTFSGDIHKMYFEVFDLPDFAYAQVKSDGVFGWGALRGNIISIDVSQSKVTALATLPEKVKTWQQCRVQTNADVLILEIPDKNDAYTIQIDTGSNGGISLAPKEWQAWKDKHSSQRRTLSAGYMPAAGVFVKEEAWADKISFGPLVFTDVPISEAHATEIDSPSCKAVFGMAMLKRLQIVVDGIKGIAYVNTKNQLPILSEHNRLGAAFVPIGLPKDDKLVAFVASESPAQKAGIENGDVLLKIDGLDVTNWQTDQSISVSKSWMRPKGTEYHLTLRRGQQTNEVTVKLENILGPDKP